MVTLDCNLNSHCLISVYKKHIFSWVTRTYNIHLLVHVPVHLPHCRVSLENEDEMNTEQR